MKLCRALNCLQPREQASSYGGQIKQFNTGFRIRRSEELKAGIVAGKIPSRFSTWKKSNTLQFLGLIHSSCFFFFFFWRGRVGGVPEDHIFFLNQKAEYVAWQHWEKEFDSEAAPEKYMELELQCLDHDL